MGPRQTSLYVRADGVFRIPKLASQLVWGVLPVAVMSRLMQVAVQAISSTESLAITSRSQVGIAPKWPVEPQLANRYHYRRNCHVTLVNPSLARLRGSGKPNRCCAEIARVPMGAPLAAAERPWKEAGHEF